MVYLIPILISSFLFLLSKTIDNKTSLISNQQMKQLLVVFSSIFVILVLSLRWDTGFDWDQYITYFKTVTLGKKYLSESFEPLFYLFTYLIAHITNSYNVYLFVISLSSVFIFINWLRPLQGSGSKLVGFITTYSFILPFYMGSLRQSIALALSAIGVTYLLSNKKVSALLIFSIATFFHYSAILNIFYFLLFGKKIFNRTYRFFVYILALFPLLSFIFLSFLSLFQITPVKKLITYIGYSQVLQDINYAERNLLLISERMLFFLIFLWAVNGYCKRKEEDSNLYLFLYSYVFSTIFYISGIFTFRNLAGRGIIYFRFPEVVLLSMFPEIGVSTILSNRFKENKLIMNQYLKIILFILLYFYIVFRFWFTIIKANSMFYLPYRNILGL